MKTSLKAKLLQHLLKKKAEGGFTLIELLVVIIIIGILAAIALPSFLNQANRAKESEANTYIGSINRGQQAYRLENPSFAPDFSLLDVGISSTTTNYTYTIPTGVDGLRADVTAAATDPALKSFRGCVSADTAGKTGAKIVKTSGGTTTPPVATDCVP